jgi:soluble lytic murein transglycosylase-like protein
MKLRNKLCCGLATIAVTAMVCPAVHAAEHVTLRNGFELDCVRRVAEGDRVRLYLMPSTRQALVANAAVDSEDAGYMEVSASAVLRVESIPDPPMPVAAVGSTSMSALPAGSVAQAPLTALNTAEMRQMLTRAGALHNIDIDLLASVVQAESGGNVRAVSRAGAQGLMQLMPGTASELGVKDSFAPEQNIGGGTAYLDALLTRYRDNIALALAAYNAGPEAVDRYHGIPPYAETRAYVARVIREFNRRKRAAGVGLMAAAK